jgi:Uma2 family endonuclease
MAAPIYYTADMVRALPDDGNRYEVVHGELLVTPAPRLWHQKLVWRLGAALETYLHGEPVGEVFASPADISWGRDVLVQPDVFVVPPEEARALRWGSIRTLLLAVEILSPSSRRADRFTKRRLYQERGVVTYWMIDGDQHFRSLAAGRRISGRGARARTLASGGSLAAVHAGAGGSIPADLRKREAT